MDTQEASEILREQYESGAYVYVGFHTKALESWGRLLVGEFLDDVPGLSWELAVRSELVGNGETIAYSIRTALDGEPWYWLDVYPDTGQFEWLSPDRRTSVEPDVVGLELIRLRFPDVTTARVINLDGTDTIFMTRPGLNPVVVHDLRTSEQRGRPSWRDRDKY